MGYFKKFAWCGGLVAALAATSSAQIFESEPNDSTSQATRITSGVYVSAQLIRGGDLDYFEIDVPAPGVLELNLWGRIVGRTIALLSSGNALLANYNITYGNSSSRIEFSLGTVAGGGFVQRVAVPSAGKYILRFTSDSSFTDTDQYYLRATFRLLIPSIDEAPLAQTTAVGGSATFAVAASGVPPLSYQWRKDGVVIPGATSAKYYLPSASLANAGRYSVVVSNLNGAVSSSEATLTLIDPPKLINLSTLGYLNPDLSSGFVIRGAASKRILARAVGPGLTPFGLTGVVADPALTLYDAKGNVLRFNDDWSSSDASTFSSVGAFGLTAGSRDAAIVATLDPGNYIVSATGFRGAQGLVLLEVYEIP